MSEGTNSFAPMRDGADDVYTMAEAARLKGVSYHTVSRAVRRQVLPAQRIGKMVFISRQDLNDWQPKYDRAPMQYRHRTPVPDAKPAMIDLASSDRVQLAGHHAVLLEVTEIVGRELPIGITLDLICERMAEVLQLRRVVIWDVNRNQGQATLRAAYGTPLAELPEDISLVEHPQFSGVIRKADGAVVLDVATHGDRIPAPYRHLPSLLVVPLRFGERTLGYLFADRNGVAFDLQDDQRLLARALAANAALALTLDEAREMGQIKLAAGRERLPRIASA